MPKIITDLEKIKTLSEKNLDANYEFRAYLKGYLDWSDRKLDALVHEVLADVSSQIDCTACANCCKVMGTAVNKTEIKRLARHLELTPAQFQELHVKTNEWGEKVVDKKPCMFLEDCKCRIYDDRPRDCRDFPHLDKDDFRSRLLSVVGNAELCPIVFNVYEQLKQHLGWKYKRRSDPSW